MNTERTEPVFPTGCPGTLSPVPAGLSPLSPGGPEPSGMHLRRGLVAELGTACIPGMEGSLLAHEGPMSSCGSTGTADQDCHSLPPPSAYPAPLNLGLWAQQLKVQPCPVLSSSCPGLGGCGNPVLSRARINFLTISHRPCACPGLASAHLPQSYSSALGRRDISL